MILSYQTQHVLLPQQKVAQTMTMEEQKVYAILFSESFALFLTCAFVYLL